MLFVDSLVINSAPNTQNNIGEGQITRFSLFNEEVDDDADFLSQLPVPSLYWDPVQQVDCMS